MLGFGPAAKQYAEAQPIGHGAQQRFAGVKASTRLAELSLAGVKNDRAEVRRGVAFLVGNQKDDGSWPMTPRGHPGVTRGNNVVPITYLGSAWATLGLMRSVPK